MEPEFVGEDFLDFKCPHCGALNSFPISAAGLLRECMNCLEAFLVPEKDGGAALPFPLPFETPRIRLRRFEAKDWRDLLEFEFDDEDKATSWLYEISSARPTDRSKTFWIAVERFQDEKVIGSLGLDFSDAEFNQVRVSLSASALAKSEGLVVEAYHAALGFCFKKLRVHRVIATCGGDETEAREVLLQSGFRQEAEFVKDQRVAGNWVSTFWFGMLEDEYFKD